MENSMFQIMKFWDAFNTSVIPSRDRTDLPTVGSSAMIISHKLTVTGNRSDIKNRSEKNHEFRKLLA